MSTIHRLTFYEITNNMNYYIALFILVLKITLISVDFKIY
jgi:hypothetical protein